MTTRMRALAISLVTAASIIACSANTADQGDQPHFPRAEGTQTAYRDAFEIQREFAGLVVPRQTTDVGFELSGEIVAIEVDEGSRVRPGQTLARLDTALLLAERDELAAQLQDLEAQIDLNRSSLKRAADLKQKGFTSDQRIDELHAEQRSLAARLARVRAGLNANHERLAQSVLTAPFAGTVSRRFADQGAIISPGQPVLRIIEHGMLEARIGVPVRLHDRFSAGHAVTVLAAGTKIPGTVIAVSREVTRATLTVPVRIALPSDTPAVPGDQAYLLFSERQDQRGFWIPAGALIEGIRGLWNVYAMVPDDGDFHRLEARDVKVLYFDDTRAFVSGAVEEDEWLVAAGTQRFVPGQRVRLQQGPMAADTLAAQSEPGGVAQ